MTIIKVCKKCGENITDCIEHGWMHVCPGAIISVKTNDGSKDDQKKWFAKDILQPYTKEKKINGDFIKTYGKQNHPSFNS